MSSEAIGISHGRVNLIGEHTDYNDGFVLPALIPQSTKVVVRKRDGGEVHVLSANLGAFHFRLGEEKPSGHWSDYVAGVVHILARAGHDLSGMELKISSDIPIGSGLSSSAALNLAVMRAVRELFHLNFTDRQAAIFCQQVENDFVGARVGIMDPMACALAKPEHALFLDTRSLQVENIPLPRSVSLIVIHSGVSHRNVGGGYSERRAQCEQAAHELGVKSLRDLSLDRLKECERTLANTVFRRVRHVLTENERVLKTVGALQVEDFQAVGALFDSSHASLRDDYEVSIPEIDTLVECMRGQAGVFGARITGGGFGGSIVALAPVESAARLALAGAGEFTKRTGLKPTVLLPRAET